MIHLCFPLHDAKGIYSKYLGTAICSVLEHTNADISIHILHDETLSVENRRRFEEMVSRYKRQLFFYEINTRELNSYHDLAGNFTIGTLFRLMIPDILPHDIERLLYFDADLLVLLDIVELWKIPLEGNLVAARVDAREERWLCDVVRLTTHEEYFNAGVLLMNLAQIRRQYRLLEQSCDFFHEHPDCQYADQDAMNTLFRGCVKWLPERYNCYTKILRRRKIDTLVPAIYHFAGDIIDWEEPKNFDFQYLYYWCKSPWGSLSILQNNFMRQTILAHKKTLAQQVFFRRLTRQDVKKIVFGVRSVLLPALEEALGLWDWFDYFLDNDSDLHGAKIKDRRGKETLVLSPNEFAVANNKSCFIIVLSQKFYRDIRKQLIGYGLRENEDFIDGRLLLTQRQGGYAPFHDIDANVTETWQH